ncbi:MAG: hypothetical protein Q9M39_10030 [Sulfurovum sp.]|nr:hypothetical protein [Sulfurovum sp.]
MNKKIISITIVTVIVIGWNLMVAYVDNHLQSKKDTAIYNSCHKVWAARGLYKNHNEQNSIISMQRAFANSALGVEVDFYYDVKMNRFIVSHNKPIKSSGGNLVYTKKNGKLLTIEKLLKATGEGHYFWFDYKNLDKLTAQETEKAIERLLSITQKDAIGKRLYIEGSNPLILSKYTHAGFKTILGIHPLRESNPFASMVINAYKIAYYFTDISAIALPYGSIDKPIYGKNTEKNLSPIPIFLFHVPDNKDLLESLLRKSSIKVLLVGRDVSVDRFDANACE